MENRVRQQFGNYRLLHLLGTGGFAEVYLGEHIHLHTPAAIKILAAHFTSQEVEQFRNEARLLIAHLKHPNIVHVLDFDLKDGVPFLVMDYAAHGTLRQQHAEGRPVPFETVLSYVKQIATALQYAHEKKIVHRDVKPENMLVGDQHEILLSDFGIAVMAHSTASLKTEAAIGTMAYIAPEQLQNKPRPASDQYALGVVVYEWLTGTLPFTGSSIGIAKQHLFDPPPPLRTKIPTIPEPVEEIVLKALNKDPHQRFPDMQAFATALEQTLQPPLALSVKPQEVLVLQPTQIAALPLSSSTSPSTKHITVTFATQFAHSGQESGRPINSIDWSPNGRSLASCCITGRIAIWDALTGQQQKSIARLCNQVAWSNDGDRVFALDFQAVTIWDVTTEAKIQTLDACLDTGFHLCSMAVFPDETRVVVADQAGPQAQKKDAYCYVLDTTSGKILLTHKGRKKATQIRLLACLPGSRSMISSVGNLEDTTIQIWDSLTGDAVLTNYAHAYGVDVVAASPDGKRIASRSIGGAYIWDAATGNTLATLDSSDAMVLAWSPDSQYVVSGGRFGMAYIWNAATGQCVLKYQSMQRDVEEITTTAWSPDGNYVAFGGSKGTISVLRINEGNSVKSLKTKG